MEENTGPCEVGDSHREGGGLWVFWRHEQDGVAVEEGRHLLLLGEHYNEEGTVEFDTDKGGVSQRLLKMIVSYIC